MTVWHYTTSRTTADGLQSGDWLLCGDECQKVLQVSQDYLHGEPTTFYTYAYGDGVSVENPSEVWDWHYPADHVVTLIHFKAKD